MIDAARLWTRLMQLAEIGATAKGGVDRQALTEGEIAAWRLVIGWAEAAGMTAATDAAGNLFLTLAGRDPTLAPVMIGSHLDTQPTGGKFDGAFGVMAALETAVSLPDPPMRDVVVVAWMNEEGSRFAPGMMGSEAFAGLRPLDTIRATRDANGITAGDALDRLHEAFAHLPRHPLGFPVGCYIEPHIEQGTVLEQAGRTIGVVTGIQGKKTFEIAIDGAEGHAGTLAMAQRRDAVAAFARIAAALHAEIGAEGEAVRFTIGRVQVQPNAPSVVPSRVTFRIDLRHPDNAVLDRLGSGIAALTAEHAPPCRADVTPLVDAPSNAFDADLQAQITAAAAALGHGSMPILSAAGHDARHLAALCPAAMIFIPCRDGVSHAEHEYASPADVAAGAAVLAEVVASLSKEPRAMDMADMPAQLPASPGSAAASRARFFNSGNAFNIKLAPVPPQAFDAEATAATATDAPTGFVVCDQSAALGCAMPATSPLILARYAVIRAGDSLVADFSATGGIWYVLRGQGNVQAGDDGFAWGPGDVFVLPGGVAAHLAATEHAVLWCVTNEPLFALEGARPASPDAAPVRAVHYPAAEIARQLALIAAASTNETTSGRAVIFSSDRTEALRNITPGLTLSLNTLPPGEAQRAHRHNSAAVTLILQGENCHSTVNGTKNAWRRWTTMVTPPGAPHSHHNDGAEQALFLIVQDGGLHYHARTMNFAFEETP